MKNKAFRLIASSLTLRKIAKPKRNITTGCQVDWRHHIIEQTEVSTNHLTPEIPLRLITRNCPLWHQKEDESVFKDPFWAFYWPGGQALTRFILDHPEVVRGRSVLDVGSGCGASAIAAVKSGASQVTANDIDLVAIEAIHLNCELNSVTIATSLDDLIGSQNRGNWEVVFLGDMFYDRNSQIECMSGQDLCRKFNIYR
ncbi:hypothetical protein BSL78_00086 [Apostichopus japonicus]|uniref:ETFB lysine methyltransferase n=1 Tax=Stichopus japonicus TaxID=307972 RepID=A0A2G8LRT5_STIJA|nr:hypothetical protein BSL78_00086 [Apostichopus japonicus]